MNLRMLLILTFVRNCPRNFNLNRIRNWNIPVCSGFKRSENHTLFTNESEDVTDTDISDSREVRIIPYSQMNLKMSLILIFVRKSPQNSNLNRIRNWNIPVCSGFKRSENHTLFTNESEDVTDTDISDSREVRIIPYSQMNLRMSLILTFVRKSPQNSNLNRIRNWNIPVCSGFKRSENHTLFTNESEDVTDTDISDSREVRIIPYSQMNLRMSLILTFVRRSPQNSNLNRIRNWNISVCSGFKRSENHTLFTNESEDVTDTDISDSREVRIIPYSQMNLRMSLILTFVRKCPQNSNLNRIRNWNIPVCSGFKRNENHTLFTNESEDVTDTDISDSREVRIIPYSQLNLRMSLTLTFVRKSPQNSNLNRIRNWNIPVCSGFKRSENHTLFTNESEDVTDTDISDSREVRIIPYSQLNLRMSLTLTFVRKSPQNSNLNRIRNWNIPVCSGFKRSENHTLFTNESEDVTDTNISDSREVRIIPYSQLNLRMSLTLTFVRKSPQNSNLNRIRNWNIPVCSGFKRSENHTLFTNESEDVTDTNISDSKEVRIIPYSQMNPRMSLTLRFVGNNSKNRTRIVQEIRRILYVANSRGVRIIFTLFTKESEDVTYTEICKKYPQ
ncbi:hypothetical protein WA026_019642 [Henosepilachna vigintioctopunctata]|uniref:Uncharacterized protein n=1 Tax=Henosepilachna vigintioctopunctata TaxID=420089 RepID=A0AAW1TWR1_9CUCU